MDLSNRLKETCKAHGTTIASLEKQLGFGNGTIGKWWKNGRVPNYANLAAAADALGVSVAYLAGETDDSGIKKAPAAEGGSKDRAMDSIFESKGSGAASKDGFTQSEKTLLLLARHLEQIPEETRNRLVKNFSDNIDLYLDSMGIPRKDK